MRHTLQDLVHSIGSIPGSNDKIARLAEYSNDNKYISAIMLLRRVFDTSIVLGISKKTVVKLVEIDTTATNNCDFTWINIFDSDTPLQRLQDVKVADEAELEYVVNLFERKLRMGMNVKSINKALTAEPNKLPPIPTPKYMRCAVFDEKTKDNISYPCIMQLKEDSEFINIFVDSLSNATLGSRNGKKSGSSIYQKRLTEEFKKHNIANVVIHGELKLKGIDATRSVLRGLISSLVKAPTTSQAMQEKIVLAKNPMTKKKLEKELRDKQEEWDNTDRHLVVSAWDIIPLPDYHNGRCDTAYKWRLKELNEDVCNKISPDLIQLTPTSIAKSEEDIDLKMIKVLKAGEEGLIVKDVNMIWKDGTSKQQLKVKEFHTFEMVVVGWNPGSGVRSEGIGSLKLASSDHKITTSASGLSLEECGLVLKDPDDSTSGYVLIDGFDLNKYDGCIVEVKANEVSKADQENWSLIFPSIVHFRHDKDEADDSDYICNLFTRKEK